jgi:hypothetical protein
MIQFFKNMLGMGPVIDYKSLVSSGAIILDVRSKAEYDGGHIKGSKLIPLPVLSQQLSSLDKSKVIITCCASGMRSEQAKGILLANGFKEVYNGGGWSGLNEKLN